MFKNVATKIALFAFDTTTGAAKTGDAANLTAYVSKDYGSVTVLADTSATEMDSTNAKGWYLFDVAQAESNADALLFTAKSTTANVSIVGQYIHTTPNRFTTLVIDAAGLADANMVKAGPTGSGTAQTAGDIIGDTNDIQARLPAALVSGRMDSSVGAMAANVLTATAINADAFTAAKFAADVTTELQAGLATSAALATVQADTDDIQSRLPAALTAGGNMKVDVLAISGDTTAADNAESFFDGTGYAGTNNVIPSVTTVTGNVNGNVGGNVTGSVGSIASGGITATSIAADAIGASELATDAVNEIAAAVWAVATRELTALDEDNTTIDLDASVRAAVGLASANLDTQLDALPTAAENATAVWGAGARSLTVLDEDSTTLDLDATIRAAVGLASANLDTQLGAIDDFVDTEVAAIKAVTDKLDNTLENTSDGYIFTANALQQAPSSGGPTAAAIADAVWEEAIADHSGTSGSTAEALAAAGSAGDPWATALPGAYGSGTAGKIVGDNLNATVSSRATQTSVDAIDDFVDTEVAAIKAKTDQLTFTVANQVDVNVVDWKGATAPAMTGDAFARLGAPAGASVSADVAAVKVDTAAIKAKTDNLPTDPADASDIAGAFATVNTKLDTIDDFIDTEVAAIKAKTDNLPASPAASGDIPSAATIADAVWDEAVDGATTARESIAIQNSFAAGEVSGQDTLSPAFRDLANTKDRITGDLDTFGNRSNVVTDGT